VEVVDPARLHLRERAREEVGLLLVVPLERDAIPGAEDRLERLDDEIGAQLLAVREARDARQP
jgi:hypothetical protein